MIKNVCALFLFSCLSLMMSSCIAPQDLSSFEETSWGVNDETIIIAPTPLPPPIDVIGDEVGFDMNGEMKACQDTYHIMPGLVCTTEMKAGDYFAVLCQEEGGDVINCGCHDNICSIDISEGGLKQFGMNKRNEFKSCVPTAEINECESTEFTRQCELSGGDVIACDCQNFLCQID